MLPGLTHAVDVKTYIPANAYQYLPVVEKEVKRVIPDIPSVGYFGSLIEQESCISLSSRRCWLPTSELNTSRELGVGVGQLTKAFKKDGSIRFDALSELRQRHKVELEELSWSNIKKRPDLQIRAITLMTRDNYRALFVVKDPMIRLAMADAAYNGGLGGVKSDRTICGLKSGCDPQKWFGHVEHTSNKSRKPIYGTRSAFFINREHVENVMKLRLLKYETYFDTKGNKP